MIFAIVAGDNPKALGAAIAQNYPSGHFQLAEGQWLVVDNGTAKEVSDKLGITSGERGGALVIAMAGYFGRKPANLWEWIMAKSVQAANG